MLLELLEALRRADVPLGDIAAFRYLSFRSAFALLLAFFLALGIAPWLIRRLREIKAGQQIRDDRGVGAISLAEMHAKKIGTPTGGGVMIVVGLVGAALLFGDFHEHLVWLMLMTAIGFALIGFADDYLKVSRRNSRGLPGRWKLVGQWSIGLAVGAYLHLAGPGATYHLAGPAGDTSVVVGMSHLSFPFLKNFYPDLGWLYVPFVALVLVASSNAVNLTDGLDGLAIGVSIIVSVAFAVVIYLVGRPDYAHYLLIPHVPGSGETLILVAALIGAGMGFLWHNAHPASIFMGDTGSLMIGGLLGLVAVVTKSELLLLIIGGIFVVETLSVILQVGSFKTTGRRIFRMAPLHHHFEKLGWHEPQIIARFYIIASLLAMFGLSTLKLR
jgi:phospho-N-acetylmuramoyl-pentapeptide-transferase